MTLTLNSNLYYNNSNSDSQCNNLNDIYYSKQETINDVQFNFNYRRYNSAEGKLIEICDSDGNVISSDNCLVQFSSNPLREFFDYRKVCFPNNFNILKGSYIKYENEIWLTDSNIVDVDGAYKMARINKCNYKLKWQNEFGKIITRYCYSQDASSYSNGISGNNIITLGSDQIMIRIPFDDETSKIGRAKKFYIDYYNDKPTCYELTRHDRSSFMDIAGNGICSWILTETAYTDSEIDLKYQIPFFDEQLYFDSIDVNNNIVPVENIDGYIKYLGKNFIKVGVDKILNFVELDLDGNEINETDVNYNSNYIWKYDINEEYKDLIDFIPNGSSVSIKINYSYLSDISNELLTVSVSDINNNILDSIIFSIGE